MKDKLYHYKFILTRVIDGDTVVGDIKLGFDLSFQNQRVRLLHINTPEIRGEERPEGLKAKEYLINLISDKDIIIHSFSKDNFGRILAELFFEDDNEWFSANVVLLNEGLALPYE